MKITLSFLLIIALTIFIFGNTQYDPPVISDISYSNINHYDVTINWKTNVPADSKVRWMKSDSNYQPVIYTDSVYSPVADTIHSVTLNYLMTSELYVFEVSSTGAGGTSIVSNNMFATKSITPGVINVWFSGSVDTSVSNGEKAQGNVDLEEKLNNRIDSANYGIDACIFDFNIDNVFASLLKAKRRNVSLRIITDSRIGQNWLDSFTINQIPFIKRNYDTANGRSMHNQFWIFDARVYCSSDRVYLWLGSADVTDNSLHQDKNNVLEIQERTIAHIFTREFEEMWGSHTNYPDTAISKFGSAKTDNVPHLVDIHGTMVELYFTPSDSLEKRIGNIIEETNKTLNFCIYNFTSERLKNYMFEKRNYISPIAGIFDLSQSGYGVYMNMKQWADVWIDSTQGLLYHKYLIKDANFSNHYPKLVTGSYEWTTKSNLYNDESILIFNSPRIANLFYQEFHQRYKESSGHPLGIMNVSSVVPGSFILHQNYPNPFNPTTKIKFEIYSNTNVKLSVFDILGKKITTLINGKLNTGVYETEFDASGLSSGIYFYRLETESYNAIKRMVYLK